MKKATISVFILCFCTIPSFTQIFISTNADMTVDGVVNMAIVEIDFHNNGTFNAGNGKVFFKETAASTNLILGGDSITIFNKITIDLQTQDLVLSNDIAANDSIVFTNGNCDLNGHDVNLGANGLLHGEDQNKSFVGSLGGHLIKTSNLNAPLAANPGNLGAVISTSANLGSTTIKRGHQVQTSGSGTSIRRYFDIMPTNNTGLNATLRFYYLDTELASIPEAEFKLWRQSAGTWEDMGFTTRHTTDNYVELISIDAFSRWTLTNDANALPVELIAFDVEQKGAHAALLSWSTVAEINNRGFEIQRATESFSSNGLEWFPIGFVEEEGTGNQLQHYDFLDQTPQPGLNYYRLRQIDFDGKSAFSVIKTLVFDWEEKHLLGDLYPNPYFAGADKVNLPMVTSEASHIQVQITDYSGKQLRQESYDLEAGKHLLSLNVNELTAGIYQIIFLINQERFIKRLVVQY